MVFEEKVKQAQVHLAKNDKILAGLIKIAGDCTIKPHKDYYGELVDSIVSQQLSSKASATIWNRVIALFDNKLPTPDQLIAVDADVVRACGVSYPKIGYMKDLAQHIIDGRLDLDHISTLSNEELITQLTAVKGIGDWSAHMFMIFSLGRLDILPVGDLGIKKSIMLLYGLKELPDKFMIEKIAADNKWHPYESVASWYLWHSLDNK
jgi:DNA-3-methyladenine glycosylase II